MNHYVRSYTKLFNNLIVIKLFLILFMMMTSDSYAEFDEQLAICTRGISLANTCTADPPGIMSIHYNPAGLSLLPDGKTIDLGLTIPIIKIKSRVEADPNAKKFLDGSGPNATGENAVDVQHHPEKLDPIAGKEGTSGPQMYLPLSNKEIPFLLAPTMGLSTKSPDSKWTFAVGSYAPYAVGLTHNKDDDPMRYAQKSVVQQHLIYAAPSASYKINNSLSLGFSIGMGQTYTSVTMDMRSPSDMIALTKVLGDATNGLEIPIISELTLPSPWFGGGVAPYDKIAQISMALRDDFSPSYNLGMLWQPRNWFSFGACYQSEIRTEQTGRYSFQHSPQFSAMMNWMRQGMILPVTASMLNLPTSGEDQYGYCSTTSFSYPQRIQSGIKLQPIKELKFLCDVNWAQWSVMKENRIVFDQDISVLRLTNIMGYGESPNQMVLKRNYKDTIGWSAAFEYLPTDWFTLRAGYEYRPTSVRAELYDGMSSIPDLHNIGSGFGIKLDNGVEINFAFAYIFNNSFSVPNGSSVQLNSNDWTKPVYNPFVGLNYYQETKIYMFSSNMSMPLETLYKMTKDGIKSVKKAMNVLNPF